MNDSVHSTRDESLLLFYTRRTGQDRVPLSECIEGVHHPLQYVSESSQSFQLIPSSRSLQQAYIPCPHVRHGDPSGWFRADHYPQAPTLCTPRRVRQLGFLVALGFYNIAADYPRVGRPSRAHRPSLGYTFTPTTPLDSLLQHRNRLTYPPFVYNREGRAIRRGGLK